MMGTSPIFDKPIVNGSGAAEGTNCSVELCETPVYARGWCNRHWQRWRRHGDPTALHPGSSYSVGERQRDRVARDIADRDRSACWLDSFVQHHRQGYPLIGKRMVGHLALEADGKPRPSRPQHVMRHLCEGGGDPRCWNPDHLAWGTYAENSQDMLDHGRHRTNPAVGERASKARLTEIQVRDIRERLAIGESGRGLSREYGVAPSAISNINRRLTWRHI